MMSAANKSYDHVKNDDVKKLFMQEQELMKRLVEVRTKAKESRTERDEKKREDLPKQQKELDAIDEKINKLRKQKDEIHTTMNSVDSGSQINRMERQGIQDHLRIVRMDIEPLERKLTSLVMDLDGRQQKAEKLKKEVVILKNACGGKNAHSMGQQIESMKRKVVKETEKGNESLAKSLKKEIRTLETERVKAEKYHLKNTALKAMLAEITDLSKEADEKTPELVSLRKKKEEYEKKLAAMPFVEITDEMRKAQDVKREKAQEQLLVIAKKIDDLQKEKFDVRNKKSETAMDLDEATQKYMKERDELEAQVTELNKKIPRKEISIEVDYLFELVGPGGATIKQIEEDFGVVIDIRRQEGQAVVKGTACEECAEAVQGILEQAKENRNEETMQIDPDVGGEFIGSGGSQIQLLQTQSGCNINFSRETGTINIVGSKENIAKAVALINDFKSSAFRTVLEFGAAAVPFLRGNLMKQWQERYACRMIRVNPEAKTIVIIGQEENVKKAAKEIAEFAEGAGSAANIAIPSTVPHFVIIGTKGERVRSIEAETGCILDVKPEMVKIAGTPANIERAKKLLNTLISENVREETKVPYKKQMHTYLTRRRPAPKTEEHVDPNAEAETAGGSPPKRENRDMCLLEQIRVKHNCDTVRADQTSGQIHIRGPKDAIKRCVKDLQDALNFTGMEKEVIELENAVVRYLCLNIAPAGTRGITTRLDAVRAMPGIEEISADFRGDSKRVELIGKKEAIEAAKEKLLGMAKEIESRMGFMEIEAGKVGFLLGSGGQNVRQMEADFGAMFHIPRTNRDAPRTEPVTVTIIAPDDESLQAAKDEAEKVMASRY